MGANADTVKNGWDAFAKGDMDAATATTSDSAEIVIPESLPWGGTYTGPDGFKEMIGKFALQLRRGSSEPAGVHRGRRRARAGHGLGRWQDEERQRAQRRLDLALQGRPRQDRACRVLRRHRDGGQGTRLAGRGLTAAPERKREPEMLRLTLPQSEDLMALGGAPEGRARQSPAAGLSLARLAHCH